MKILRNKKGQFIKGTIPYFKGKHLDEKTKSKLSESLKKRIFTKEAWENMIKGLEIGRKWFKGKHRSIENRKKISESQKGKQINENQRRGLEEGRKKHTKLIQTEGYWNKTRKELARKSHLGNKISEMAKLKMSLKHKEQWKNEEYRKKVLGRREMSSLEKKVNQVIQKYNLPYKFVGNGEFFIERKNPDFININGEKKAIEVYWNKHKEEFRKGGVEGWKEERVDIFKKYGWKIIFMEGTGLTNKKILNFIRRGGDYY